MYWSLPLWNLIHTLSEKCEKTDIIVITTFNFIKQICMLIPCQKCVLHSSRYFKRNHIQNNDIKTYFFNFHNVVKSKKRLKTIDIRILEKYKNYNIDNIFNVAINKLKIGRYQRRILNDKYNKINKTI